MLCIILVVSSHHMCGHIDCICVLHNSSESNRIESYRIVSYLMLPFELNYTIYNIYFIHIIEIVVQIVVGTM